jgi:putative MATE family efflux protein
MLDVSREEVTGGSLPRVLVVLAVPLVAQNLALVAQQVVDLFWVGRLGGDAVAAVGLSSAVVGLVSVPLLALFTGSQVVTSQRVGADEVAAARQVPFTATAIALAVSAVLGAGLVVVSGPLTELLADGRAATLAAQYLAAYALALLAMGASDTLESGFTGWGDTRAALYVNLTAVVVNVVVDPLLILGLYGFPKLGVAGAALATAVGYGTGAALAVGLAVRGRDEFRVTAGAVRPDLATAREVVSVARFVAVQSAGRQLARLLVVAVVSVAGGAAGLAAYYIGQQVAGVAFIPAQGLAQASTSVVGQNLGADRPDRARRATWIGVAIGVSVLAVVAVTQWFTPAAIARLFVPEIGPQALSYAVLYLKVLAIGYPALGAIYTAEAGFEGASRTDVGMYATLLQYWAVRLPIAAVGAVVLQFGVAAVFWAVTISNLVAAVGLVAYYHYSSSNGMLHRAAEEAGASAAD